MNQLKPRRQHRSVYASAEKVLYLQKKMIMKQRIYIDTSVIGGCFDKEFKEWSNKLFDEFRNGNKIAVISDITLDELSFSRPEVRNQIDTIPNEHKEYILNH
jgi:hypothetical protein